MEQNIDKLIAAREEIDRRLREQFEKDVAVLFTDMVGSTEYFERMGDIEGVAWVRKHNAVLFPVIEQWRGRVVKTIGDAIMAVFADPPDAVRCAIQMQQALEEHRRSPDGTPVRIRIGAHAGPAVHVERDVFGDAVNTAARIAAQARGDEILVSEDLFKRVPPADGFEARPRGRLDLKGKALPIPVVAVSWNLDAADDAMEPDPEATPEIIVLELGLGPAGMKVAVLDGAKDKGTVKRYAEVPMETGSLGRVAARFDSFLGGGADSYHDRIRELGRELFDRFLPSRAQKVLRESPHEFVRIQVDDEIAHIPWELSHDGSSFLATRYAVGRTLAARDEPQPEEMPSVQEIGHALVVSNPSGDLDQSAEEGRAITGLLDDGFVGRVVHLRGPCSIDQFVEGLAGCRLLHFAGHILPNRGEDPGGFQLADGVLSPTRLTECFGSRAPSLVFANGCFASTSHGWTGGGRATFDLAAVMLLRGVRHFVGPMGDIPDNDALIFSLRFWEATLRRQSLGESVRRARNSLVRSGAEQISFAGYVLYGDPRNRLPANIVHLVRSHTRSEAGPPELSVPARPSAPGRPAPRPARPRWRWGAWGLVVAAMVAVAAAVTLRVFRTPSETAAPQASAAPQLSRSGPVRVSVLPFRNLGEDPELAFLGAGLAETIITELGQVSDIELVERSLLSNEGLDRSGVLVKDVLGEIEFGQGKFVDPSTAAALGKIRGVEVVLVGGFQRSGPVLRATARVVDVESGEVLDTVRREGPAAHAFALQDTLATAIRQALPDLCASLRSPVNAQDSGEPSGP